MSDVERDGMLSPGTGGSFSAQLVSVSQACGERPRTYHEFICFIHLVTCTTRGVPVPDSLPPQLLDSLMNLEPLEVLVAEREESRSRSQSPQPVAKQTEVFDSLGEGFPSPGGEAFPTSFPAESFPSGDAFGGDSFGDAFASAGVSTAEGFGDGFGFGTTAELSDEVPKKSKKKREKVERFEVEDWARMANVFTFERLQI